MDVQALEGGAGLPHVQECSLENIFGDRLDRGAWQHDGGIVAAQLQGQALEVAGGAAHHALAGSGGAGEDNFLDTGVGGDRTAEPLLTGHAIDHAPRHVASDDFHQAQGAQGGQA
ncbi:hypothetical protein D3C78_1252620 [compost metagenome]